MFVEYTVYTSLLSFIGHQITASNNLLEAWIASVGEKNLYPWWSLVKIQYKRCGQAV
jgi:hypothetical protein